MKRIKGFKGYFIDERGSVFSVVPRNNHHKPKTPRKISVWDDRGYPAVHIGKKKRYIHRLLLETFVGPAKKDQECRHLDGNTRNNDIGNLAWGSRSENQMDRSRHGTSNRGMRHGMAKYDEDQVKKIKKMHDEGMKMCRIAEKMQIPASSVSYIVNDRKSP